MTLPFTLQVALTVRASTMACFDLFANDAVTRCVCGRACACQVKLNVFFYVINAFPEWTASMASMKFCGKFWQSYIPKINLVLYVGCSSLRQKVRFRNSVTNLRPR